MNIDFELDSQPWSTMAENTFERTDSASTLEKVKNTFSRSASIYVGLVQAALRGGIIQHKVGAG